MAYFKLTVVLIIGVLQVCTVAIASEEESDPAKLFSADELELAKNVGLTGTRLVEGKAYGFTFDEMIKIQELRKIMGESQSGEFEYMGKLCKILDPAHKTATSYTNAQETIIPKLLAVTSFLVVRDRTDYTRSTICDYVSQPDLLDMEATSFGLQLTPYVVIRYFKMKAQKASGAERVQMAKEMCCVFKHVDNKVEMGHFNFNGLPDEEMKEFGELWNRFETSNTSNSFINVCDFLQTKSPTNECAMDVMVDAVKE